MKKEIQEILNKNKVLWTEWIPMDYERMKKIINKEKGKGGGKVERMKILVIDDNQDFREFLSGLIGFYRADADVILAENGVKGLRIFSNNPASFDVVFTDRRMPGMLGEEVVREIKKFHHRQGLSS